MKESTQNKLEELTFDELVELVAHRVHSALLEGGGKAMKQALRLWMGQVILWKQGQK